MAKYLHCELLLVHVLRAPIMPGVPAAIRGKVRSLAQEDAEAKLRRLLHSARSAGVRARSLVLDGIAADEQIVAVARRTRANLIVIGTHGRTGLSRMLLGSVASRVAATAPCPVLTVRP
jgi:nucleotide-binding universal stress UspA family protein